MIIIIITKQHICVHAFILGREDVFAYIQSYVFVEISVYYL